MPPLRSHRKSRTGCLQCKKRRVKCDESAHPCANCSFRGLDCAYPEPPAPASRPPPALSRTASPAQQLPTGRTTVAAPGNGHTPHSQEISSQNQEATPPSPPNPYRLQLELMHTFSTSTYKSLFAEPTENHTWQVLIPRRALEAEAKSENSFLLDGILSVAALHTAVTLNASPNPHDQHSKQTYIDAAMTYQSRALEPFRRAIQHISQENCDVVFANSLITIVNGIAVPQVLRIPSTRNDGDAYGNGNGNGDQDPSTNINTNMLETIFTLFELVQGTAALNRITGTWLKDKDPCLVYENFWGAAGSSTSLDADTDDALNRLSELNKRENEPGSPFHGARHALIDTAISLLRRCFRRYTALQDPVSVLTWLAIVDRGFVDCLRRRETVPLLVLMHWGALLAMLDGRVWWAQGSGRGLVRDVMGILGVGQRNPDDGHRIRLVEGGYDFGGALGWVREVLRL
ncbi:hypothetical protein BJX64DRAFT_268451 [Aspergillus heterothallicus]